MKEATGELNMTVITVVAIAAVGAFFYAFVWPNIQNNLKQKQCENSCGGNAACIESCKGGTSGESTPSSGETSKPVCDAPCCGEGFNGVTSSGQTVTCGKRNTHGNYKCNGPNSSTGYCE